jgi:translation initiation factor IF-2
LTTIGKIKALRHFKKEITEAPKGTECGMLLDDGFEVMVGDTIQQITETFKPRVIE